MAYCSNCGAEVQDGASFCTSCGSRIAPEKMENSNQFNEIPLPNAMKTDGLPQTPSNNKSPNNNQTQQGSYVYINNATIKQTPVRTTNSWMGILGFILSFFVFTSPLAVILGVLDLAIQKGRRHALGIWAIIIGVPFSIALIVLLKME